MRIQAFQLGNGSFVCLDGKLDILFTKKRIGLPTNPPQLPFRCNNTRKQHKPACWKTSEVEGGSGSSSSLLMGCASSEIHFASEANCHLMFSPVKASCVLHMVSSYLHNLLITTCSFCLNLIEIVCPITPPTPTPTALDLPLQVISTLFGGWINFVVYKVNDLGNTEE